MGDKEDAIVATKLDILIKDFQRFREEQNTHNESRRVHAESEDKVQASILTTQKWHTVIGTFMMGILGWVVLGKIGVM